MCSTLPGRRPSGASLGRTSFSQKQPVACESIHRFAALPEKVCSDCHQSAGFSSAAQAPSGHSHQDDGYMVDHSTAIFMFDPQGRVRLYVSQNGRSVDAMVADVRRLLAASSAG